MPKSDAIDGYQTVEEFEQEIRTCLKGADMDPDDVMDVRSCAEFLHEDQMVNAPDEFMDVIRRYLKLHRQAAQTEEKTA